MDNLTTSERLKKLRKKLGLTQEELAKELDVTTSAVGNWESKIQQIPENKMAKIAAKYGVNLNWLEGGIGEMFVRPQNERNGTLPYDYVISMGGDDTIGKIFQAYCNMDGKDKKELSRLVRILTSNIKSDHDDAVERAFMHLQSLVLNSPNKNNIC